MLICSAPNIFSLSNPASKKINSNNSSLPLSFASRQTQQMNYLSKEKNTPDSNFRLANLLMSSIALPIKRILYKT